MVRLALATVLLAACANAGPTAEVAPPVHEGLAEVQWAEWDQATFERAQAEKRIILINVVAEWCHWCHVMEETTYADPEVARLLRDHFVTIRVDSDARPDVSERYRAWGWPATAVLTPDARPVTELRGYKNPETFAEFLRGLVAERDAGTLRRRGPHEPKPTAGGHDLAPIRTRIASQMDEFWDEDAAGWGQRQKYPWPAPIELSLLRGRVHEDESVWHERAVRTLRAQLALLDPVWGGMYQYSVGGVWNDPHFEKIAMIQAGAIETYALAARATGDETLLAPARQVAGYVLDVMAAPEGGFYASQDADLRREDGATIVGTDYYAMSDGQRRAAGMPRIDTTVYADLTGLTITALCELYRTGREPADLQAAIEAAERLQRTHLVPSAGAYLHGEDDDRRGLLHLSDQAAMGRALLALYTVTGDAQWRDHAQRLGDFVLEHLQADDGGFFAHTVDPSAVGVFAERRLPVEENGQAARFLMELHWVSDGDGTTETPYLSAAHRALLRVGMTPKLPREGKVVGRLLLATELALAGHVDVTVVGEPDDAKTQALWEAALRWYEPRATVERSAPGERYPDIGTAAVYLCTDTACSSPIKDPTKLAAKADAFAKLNL